VVGDGANLALTVIPGNWNSLQRGIRHAGNIVTDGLSAGVRSAEDLFRPRQNEWMLAGAGGANDLVYFSRLPNQKGFHELDNSWPPPSSPNYPQIDPNRPINSPQYTVVTQVTLPSHVPFSGMGREEHFRLANENLYRQMLNDDQYRIALEIEYPGLFQAVSPSLRGDFPTQSPTDIGLTWHHMPMIYGPSGYNNPPGIMEVVNI
jgi:hypothetical protein